MTFRDHHNLWFISRIAILTSSEREANSFFRGVKIVHDEGKYLEEDLIGRQCCSAETGFNSIRKHLE
jgi:hypothetical protein